MDIKPSQGSLKVCQVNIWNISPNLKLALEKYVWDNNIDILTVQETKLQVAPTLKNYYSYTSSSMGKSGKEGGAAMYLSKDIKNQTRLTKFESTTCNII